MNAQPARATVAVLAPDKLVRRQIARALYAGGIDLRIVQRATQLPGLDPRGAARVLVLDGNALPLVQVREWVRGAQRSRTHVVALCSGEDREVLAEVLHTLGVENVVALHTSARALHPIFDEQELRVTVQKLLRGDIFGIDKYLGGWGNEVRSFRIRSAEDRREALSEFEGFLTDLECLPKLVPEMVAAADDVCFFAASSAAPARSAMTQIVSFGCDGQRLFFSAAQPSGPEERARVHGQLSRVLTGIRGDDPARARAAQVAPALRRAHQLVANLQPGARWEVIAGWYLRVNSATEFRQTTRSLNLFWREPGEEG